MNRIFRFSIPFISAILFLGMLIWMAGAYRHVVADSSSSTQNREIHVTTLADELNSDGDCSLREAIEAANTNTSVDACGSGGVLTDTITFDVSGTILLNSQLVDAAGGPLVIDGNVVITVSGGYSVRVFYVNADAMLSLKRLTIINGSADLGGAIQNDGILEITDSILSNNNVSIVGGGILNSGILTITTSTLSHNNANMGGAIYNDGLLLIKDSILSDNYAAMGGGIKNGNTLTLTNSIVSGNSAGDSGAIDNTGTTTIINSILSNNSSTGNAGGIHNFDTMTVTSSILSSNESTGFGGAIYNQYGKLTLTNSTLISNTTDNTGGGVSNSAMMTIMQTTLSGNAAIGQGGGIMNWGALEITNSTLSGNEVTAPYGFVSYGGGIYNSGTITITNSTITANKAGTNGGAIYNHQTDGIVALNSSIVSNNPTGGNCAGGQITDGGYNMEDSNTCDFDEANSSYPDTNPILGPLQDNGGPTWTHALLEGSPAIDHGDDFQCPAIDQRGVVRPIDGDGDGSPNCDIGSYEYQIPPDVVTISGPNEAVPGKLTYFTATVEPISTTLPLTYTWQSDGQIPISHTSRLTDTIAFNWEIPGTYAITVTASNMAGSVMDTHVITITKPINKTYLPLVINSSEEILTPIHPSSHLGGGTWLGPFIIGAISRYKRRI